MKLVSGIVLGVAFGMIDVMMTLLGKHPGRMTALLLEGFSSRFAIGFLAANVSLRMPPVLGGAIVGLLISLPDAFALKSYVGMIGSGLIFGALTGWTISRDGLRAFRIVFLAAYTVVALLFFFLTIQVEASFGQPGPTLTRIMMRGVAGAATLAGAVQPTIIRPCFFNRGQLTRLGCAATRTFKFSEDKLPIAISFPWKLSLALGILVAAANLILSAGR
ncbi:MAG TPA: hypothetical protein VMD76_09125 [Candidatus Sulfotelmatobacter sp.]|nr:hypothetical protein [Candidatus Sulfotelmatobacter sp.]